MIGIPHSQGRGGTSRDGGVDADGRTGWMLCVGAKSGKQCESGRRETEREWAEQARTSNGMHEGRVGVKVVKYGWR